jgi:protocatechuate 3,4-dioxygenase beta subunit
MDTNCRPIRGVLLDFWQTDDLGRYDNNGCDWTHLVAPVVCCDAIQESSGGWVAVTAHNKAYFVSNNYLKHVRIKRQVFWRFTCHI